MLYHLQTCSPLRQLQTHTERDNTQACAQAEKCTYATLDTHRKAQPGILEHATFNTQEANTQYLGVSRTGEDGSGEGKGGGGTCGREIKVEQTAAPIEGSGLPEERNRKKARQKRNE